MGTSHIVAFKLFIIAMRPISGGPISPAIFPIASTKGMAAGALSPNFAVAIEYVVGACAATNAPLRPMRKNDGYTPGCNHKISPTATIALV